MPIATRMDRVQEMAADRERLALRAFKRDASQEIPRERKAVLWERVIMLERRVSEQRMLIDALIERVDMGGNA